MASWTYNNRSAPPAPTPRPAKPCGAPRLASLAIVLLAAACGGEWKPVAPGMSAGAPPPPLVAAPDLGLRLEKVVRRTDGAVAFVQAPGDPPGRFHVVEKAGRIRIVEGGEVGETILDVSAEVTRDTEQGLLGLAFHPEFARNGRFFINYTDLQGDTRVVERPSGKVLLAVDQIRENHNGGHLLFGPDGKLWIGLGDGGDWHDKAGNAQSPSSYLGKMMTLDVDVAGAKPVIVARGLRNPWRYDFDARGDLYIADVGQEAWEEIDLLPAGVRDVNFGWPRTEGAHCYRDESCSRSGIAPPILEYGHGDGCSITGGVVYQGAIEELRGHYFYADYCSALVRSLRWEGGKVTASWDWKARLDPESKLANISSFAEDAAGELYIVTMWDGIYKLTKGN